MTRVVELSQKKQGCLLVGLFTCFLCMILSGYAIYQQVSPDSTVKYNGIVSGSFKGYSFFINCSYYSDYPYHAISITRNQDFTTNITILLPINIHSGEHLFSRSSNHNNFLIYVIIKQEDQVYEFETSELLHGKVKINEVPDSNHGYLSGTFDATFQGNFYITGKFSTTVPVISNCS